MKKLQIAVPLLAAFVLSPLSDARAIILFAGGEDSEFTMNGIISDTYCQASSGYGRGAIGCSCGDETSATAPTNYAMSSQFTAVSGLWIHLNQWISTNAGANNALRLGVYSPDGVMRIAVRDAAGTKGIWKISKVDAAGTFTDLATMSSPCFTGSAYHFLDLYVNYGASGQATLYCDGNSVATYSGNVTTNSATQLAQISLYPLNSSGNNCSGSSEIIVSTTDTRNLRLVTYAPVANGNTHNFDVGAASHVNTTTISFASPDASGTAGQIQEYTATGSLPAGTGSWQILDVLLSAKAQAAASGPQHLQGMVRTGSTDYTSSNLSPPQGSWGNIWTDWTINPNTGVAWTTSDLTAAGLNIGFKSQN